MLKIRRSDERGYFDFDWLKTYHSFSFGEYYNPKAMHFRNLRVFNEDRIAPKQGFPTHPHSNMEIITVVFSGSVKHKDSMGNEFEIKPGEIQIMSAGSGVTHSEFNGSSSEELHLYQIWIIPNKKDIAPRYNMSGYDKDLNGMQLICSSDARDGSIQVFQEMDLFYLNHLNSDSRNVKTKYGNVYLHVMDGSLTIQNEKLYAGDAAMLSSISEFSIENSEPVKALLFDLA